VLIEKYSEDDSGDDTVPYRCRFKGEELEDSPNIKREPGKGKKGHRQTREGDAHQDQEGTGPSKLLSKLATFDSKRPFSDSSADVPRKKAKVSLPVNHSEEAEEDGTDNEFPPLFSSADTEDSELAIE
jgi:hypothetical protein